MIGFTRSPDYFASKKMAPTANEGNLLDQRSKKEMALLGEHGTMCLDQGKFMRRSLPTTRVQRGVIVGLLTALLSACAGHPPYNPGDPTSEDFLQLRLLACLRDVCWLPRITLFWTDTNGNVGRTVAVEQEPSRLVQEILVTGVSGGARSVAYNQTIDRLYWADVAASEVYYRTETGSTQAMGALSDATSIVVGANNRVYLVDIGSNEIRRMESDGTGSVSLNFAGPSDSYSRIAVTADGSTGYATEIGFLNRYVLDGGSIVTSIVTGLNTPTGICLDEANSLLYWVDRVAGNFQRANIDGSAATVLTSGLNQPTALACNLARGQFIIGEDAGARVATFDGNGTLTGVLFTGHSIIDLALPK